MFLAQPVGPEVRPDIFEGFRFPDALEWRALYIYTVWVAPFTNTDPTLNQQLTLFQKILNPS